MNKVARRLFRSAAIKREQDWIDHRNEAGREWWTEALVSGNLTPEFNTNSTPTFRRAVLRSGVWTPTYPMSRAYHDAKTYNSVVCAQDQSIFDEDETAIEVFDQRIEYWVEHDSIRPKTLEEKKQYLHYCLTEKVNPVWWKLAEEYIEEHPECLPDGV